MGLPARNWLPWNTPDLVTLLTLPESFWLVPIDHRTGNRDCVIQITFSRSSVYSFSVSVSHVGALDVLQGSHALLHSYLVQCCRALCFLSRLSAKFHPRNNDNLLHGSSPILKSFLKNYSWKTDSRSFKQGNKTRPISKHGSPFRLSFRILSSHKSFHIKFWFSMVLLG